MPDLVHTEFDSATGVGRLLLNRPEARNPTSIAMLDAMDAGLDALTAHDGLRVVRVAGHGKTFCAGLDLDEVTAGEATVHRLLVRLSEVMRRLRRLDAITVAVVQGAAIGGGFGFLAACDFAVSHPESKLGYPPLSTCLSPALMAPWLVRKIGPSPARAMLLRGGTITGARAYELGIVTDLAERDALDHAADALIANLCTGGQQARIAMKTLLNGLDGTNEDTWLDRAALVSAEVIAGPEAQAWAREARAGKS